MLKFIIVLLLIYISVRFIFKYILPSLLGSYISKKMSEMQQQQQAYQNRKREGDVTVESSSDSKKRFSKDAGEYIDFEEVK